MAQYDDLPEGSWDDDLPEGSWDEPAPAKPRPIFSKLDSAVRAVAHGGTWGLLPAGAAAIAATFPALDREMAGDGKTWTERYRHGRDFSQGLTDESRAQNPGIHAVAEPVAGMATAFAAPIPGLSTAARGMNVAGRTVAAIGDSQLGSAVIAGLPYADDPKEAIRRAGQAASSPVNLLAAAGPAAQEVASGPFARLVQRGIDNKSANQAAKTLRLDQTAGQRLIDQFGSVQEAGRVLKDMRLDDGTYVVERGDGATEIAAKLEVYRRQRGDQLGGYAKAAEDAGATVNREAMYEDIRNGPQADLRSRDARAIEPEAGRKFNRFFNRITRLYGDQAVPTSTNIRYPDPVQGELGLPGTDLVAGKIHYETPDPRLALDADGNPIIYRDVEGAVAGAPWEGSGMSRERYMEMVRLGKIRPPGAPHINQIRDSEAGAVGDPYRLTNVVGRDGTIQNVRDNRRAIQAAHDEINAAQNNATDVDRHALRTMRDPANALDDGTQEVRVIGEDGKQSDFAFEAGGESAVGAARRAAGRSAQHAEDVEAARSPDTDPATYGAADNMRKPGITRTEEDTGWTPLMEPQRATPVRQDILWQHRISEGPRFGPRGAIEADSMNFEYRQPTLSEFVRLNTRIGKNVKEGSAQYPKSKQAVENNPVLSAKNQTHGIVARHIENAIEEGIGTTGRHQYEGAKNEFGAAKTLLPSARKARAAEQTDRFDLQDIRGTFRWLGRRAIPFTAGATAGTMAGGPIAGAAAGVGLTKLSNAHATKARLYDQLSQRWGVDVTTIDPRTLAMITALEASQSKPEGEEE